MTDDEIDIDLAHRTSRARVIHDFIAIWESDTPTPGIIFSPTTDLNAIHVFIEDLDEECYDDYIMALNMEVKAKYPYMDVNQVIKESISAPPNLRARALVTAFKKHYG